MAKHNYHYTKQIFNYSDNVQTTRPLKQNWWYDKIVENQKGISPAQYNRTDHKIYVRNVEITGNYWFEHNNQTFRESYCTIYLFKMTPLLYWLLEAPPAQEGQSRNNFFAGLTSYDPENVYLVKNLPPNAGSVWGEQPFPGEDGQGGVYQQQIDLGYSDLIELDAGEILCVGICIGHHDVTEDEGEHMNLFFDMNITSYTRY